LQRLLVFYFVKKRRSRKRLALMNLLVFASPQIQRGGSSSSTDALHCGTLKIIHKKAKASQLKRRALGCLREKCGVGEDEFVRFACWGYGCACK
jgi:hypothetical protein